jgi:hypothetical protein
MSTPMSTGPISGMAGGQAPPPATTPPAAQAETATTLGSHPMETALRAISPTLIDIGLLSADRVSSHSSESFFSGDGQQDPRPWTSLADTIQGFSTQADRAPQGSSRPSWQKR